MARQSGKKFIIENTTTDARHHLEHRLKHCKNKQLRAVVTKLLFTLIRNDVLNDKEIRDIVKEILEDDEIIGTF